MMECATFKELAALLALGGLDPAEREACEAHLQRRNHDGCLEALSGAMATVAALDGPAGAPPSRVWDAIAARIRPAARRLARQRRRTRWTAAIAVACAAALLLLVVGQRGDRKRLASIEAQLHHREQTAASALLARDSCLARVQAIEARERLRSEAVALLELPGTQLFALSSHRSAARAGTPPSANTIMHTGLERAYVVADGLAPVAGHDYALWVAKGKRVVAAGLVPVDERGRALVRVDYAVLLGGAGAPDAMMITLEPRGGGAVVRGSTVLYGAPRT